MRIERGASNTFTLAARPTLSPSKWLLRFVHATDEGVYQLCIAEAIANVGRPVQLTFTEVASSPDPQDAEVTLSPGQWNLYVYEQDDTSLNWTLAGRLVFEQLVEVVGEAIPPPAPTNPCGGDCPPTTVNGVESDTPAITVTQGGDPVGTLDPVTGNVAVPECDPCPPCDPFTATLNGVEIIDEADPCGASVALTCADLVDAVLVSGAAEDQKNGLYIASSPVNGRTSYELLPNHVIEWNGSEYILRDIFVGTDWITNNSPAIPWDGVWVEFVGGAPIEAKIDQGTIADICPCADADWTLKDTEGNVLDTGSIPSGGSDDIIAPDGHVTVNTVPYIDVMSGQTQEVEVVDSDEVPVGSLIAGLWTIADSQVQRKDSGGGDIGAPIAILAEDSINVTCPDATVQLKDSAGNNIGSADSYLSNSSNNKTAPDGTVTINNSVPTLLHTVGVKSNGSATQAIADSTITKPDGTTVGLPATVALDVRNYRSGIAYSLGRILHSGQKTVYRTGDEGTMFAAGFFDYTRPVYPTHYAEIGATFGTMAANNSFGNTLRFTDRAGSAAASSGNRFVMDHLTGIEYYVLGTYLVAASWNAFVDAGVALNATLGETGWYSVPDRVLDSITNDDASTFITAAPWSAPAASLWTSSTLPGTTTSAKFLGTPGQLGGSAKTTATFEYGIFCRRFA